MSTFKSFVARVFGITSSDLVSPKFARHLTNVKAFETRNVEDTKDLALQVCAFLKVPSIEGNVEKIFNAANTRRAVQVVYNKSNGTTAMYDCSIASPIWMGKNGGLMVKVGMTNEKGNTFTFTLNVSKIQDVIVLDRPSAYRAGTWFTARAVDCAFAYPSTTPRFGFVSHIASEILF